MSSTKAAAGYYSVSSGRILKDPKGGVIWTVWASTVPCTDPFVAPEKWGLAGSEAAARSAALRALGRGEHLEIKPRWASAWTRVLLNEAPWPSQRKHGPQISADCYEILGIARGATAAEVNAACGARLKALGMDRPSSSHESLREAVRVGAAYDVALELAERPGPFGAARRAQRATKKKARTAAKSKGAK